MEIWAGDIAFDELGADHILDVHFHSQHATSKALLPPSSKLQWADVIRVCNVPFYLFAGSALDVSTNEGGTQDCFSSVLLGSSLELIDDEGNSIPPLWQRSLQQSICGILLKVLPESSDSHAGATELLVYAAVEPSTNILNGMVTPPRSSSPDLGETAALNDQAMYDGSNLKLYAIPLDSRRLHPLTATHDLAPEFSFHDGEKKAQILPEPGRGESESQPVPGKRRKLSAVFDDATKQRRKAKGGGGEGIARAMAETNLQQPGKAVSSASQLETERSAQQVINDPSLQPSRRTLSRAATIGALPSPAIARPPSRRDSFVVGKRSSLSRVESAFSLPESLASKDSENDFEQQNKATLARIIMAGMRMYGLQQLKKGGKSQSLNESNLKFSVEEPDEYKAIYHQTFKAVSFTFRSYFPTGVIAQDTLRDVVDRLLSMFCIDPLAHSQSGTGARDYFGSQENKPHDAFDQPSFKSTASLLTETPIATRRRLA